MATTLPVDLTTSFAQRAEGGVRLVLGLPDRPEGASELRLTSGKRRVTAPVVSAGPGDVVEVLIPGGELPAGVWKLSLCTAGDPVVLEARLLANRRQPVALLTGQTPSTRMAPPVPKEVPAAPARTMQKVRHAAARTVDTVLAVLPEQPRAKARSTLVKVGRRVLG